MIDPTHEPSLDDNAWRVVQSEGALPGAPLRPRLAGVAPHHPSGSAVLRAVPWLCSWHRSLSDSLRRLEAYLNGYETFANRWLLCNRRHNPK